MVDSDSLTDWLGSALYFRSGPIPRLEHGGGLLDAVGDGGRISVHLPGGLIGAGSGVPAVHVFSEPAGADFKIASRGSLSWTWGRAGICGFLRSIAGRIAGRSAGLRRGGFRCRIRRGRLVSGPRES